MESLDSNCNSMSDNLSLYERYLRSFDVVDSYINENRDGSPKLDQNDSCEGNIDLSVNKQYGRYDTDACNPRINDNTDVDKPVDRIEGHLCGKVDYTNLISPSPSIHDNSSATAEHSTTDKSEGTDVPVSSEDSKSNCFKHPVFITSTIMENSNNAVDSVPMFPRPSESVFKLPIRELSFNGTLKHVQKLKPIVDPLSALSNGISLNRPDEESTFAQNEHLTRDFDTNLDSEKLSESSSSSTSKNIVKTSESTGDSQYEDYNKDGMPAVNSQYEEFNKDGIVNEESGKWHSESYSSLEGSFDSGVRSPDIFTDEDDNVDNVPVQDVPPFWGFLKDMEKFDKRRVRKLEETLQGILPPPSVTTIKLDAAEMLKKYYCYLPMFSDDTKDPGPSTTPIKRVSFVQIPTEIKPIDELVEKSDAMINSISKELETAVRSIDEAINIDIKHNFDSQSVETSNDIKINSVSEETESKIDRNSRIMDLKVDPETHFNLESKKDMKTNLISNEFQPEIAISVNVKLNAEKANSIPKQESDLDKSTDKSIQLKMCTEIEAKETAWPDILKCRYHDVYYNLTHQSEKLELLSLKYGERYVGAETDTSVNVYSGSLQSPSSASKRKALRLKLAANKSPGRRLSHLARRRQAFSAASLGERSFGGSRMVLIDKNYFPHRKLISSAERKSPRTRRTPGKKTPNRKTPAKKTPLKTPKSSTKKKAMRRLQMESENITRSQPRENLIKRALFISPEGRKCVPQASSSSVPAQTIKSRRSLFGSNETKSLDGLSDQFLKRKREFDDVGDNRSKIAKSLSFGGDSMGSRTPTLCRRSSEVFASNSCIDTHERHKKLLWAVSEALRVHGWRMSMNGFREKASTLAKLTRRLLELPPHAAKLAAPRRSTSEVMLKVARQYAFAIIQGRSIEECFQEEQAKIANESTKVTGYISATAYQQLKAKASTSTFKQIKENVDTSIKQEQPKSASKNVLQDKLVNIDSNSNSSSLQDKIVNKDSNSSSSSCMSAVESMDKSVLFKSHSMPSFEEAAKMRARRQISFDNVEFPKR